MAAAALAKVLTMFFVWSGLPEKEAESLVEHYGSLNSEQLSKMNGGTLIDELRGKLKPHGETILTRKLSHKGHKGHKKEERKAEGKENHEHKNHEKKSILGGLFGKKGKENESSKKGEPKDVDPNKGKEKEEAA